MALQRRAANAAEALSPNCSIRDPNIFDKTIFDKNILELKIKLAQCHAHARRYFKDVEEANPEIKEYLEFYKELSLYEKQAKDFEDLKKIRQEKSKPLIEKIIKKDKIAIK